MLKYIVIILFLPFSLISQQLIEAPSTAEWKLYDSLIRSKAPDEEAFVALQRMTELDIDMENYDAAINTYERYRCYFPKMGRRLDKIENLLKAPKRKLVVNNLGSDINTQFTEAVPVLSADGKTLYFCGLDRPDGYGGEDLYVSHFVNGEWTKAENMGNGINNETHQSPLSISTDGNRLLVYGSYKTFYGRGDIYYTDRTAKGWDSLKCFSPPVNSKYFDSDAMITSDGKAIIFVSERPGNAGALHRVGEYFHGDYLGNTDIFVCLKSDTGWSEPINLGTTVNTPSSERTPYLHPDGKTLYFSSDGHYGLGRMDVFKTTRLNDSSWTEWCEPVNLGKEVNSTQNDFGYKITTTGDIAYFSAYKRSDNYGESDIYSITLPKEVRPHVVAIISGTVKDEKGNFLEANIKWEDLSTGTNIGELKSNPQNGSYFIVLPLGKKYGYYAEKKDYLPVSQYLDLTNVRDSITIQEDIVLVSIEKMIKEKIPVRVNNVFFDFDKYDLKKESFSELNRLAEFLLENEGFVVNINAYTDSVGTDEYNIELSNKRAASVVEYLVSRGCKKDHLVAKGYGKQYPLATNSTEEGRALNRRVEIKF